MVKRIRQKEVNKMLPIIISDMLFTGKKKREITDKAVKESLYLYFINEMYDKDNFAFNEKEKEPAERKGCFIKGYVRDVWSYLGDAYRLVHNQNYTQRIKEIISKEVKPNLSKD